MDLTPRKVQRVTEDTALTSGYHHVACDTDGGAFTISLPVGDSTMEFRIANTGTSAINLNISPANDELLIGVNENFVLSDGESLHIVFEAIEGWF